MYYIWCPKHGCKIILVNNKLGCPHCDAARRDALNYVTSFKQEK